MAVELSVRWRGSSSGGRKSAARHHVAAVAEGAARRCCLYLHPDPFYSRAGTKSSLSLDLIPINSHLHLCRFCLSMPAMCLKKIQAV